MKKKFALSALLSVLVVCLLATTAFAAPPPTNVQRYSLGSVFVNGVRLQDYLEQHPGMGYVYIDDNGRTMAPLRAVADILGLTTSFREKDRAAVIDGGINGQAVFYLNRTDYVAGGKKLTMDTTPVVIEGRTHIPVRFLVESMGGSVYYTPPGKGQHLPIVEIYYHANDVTPTPPEWAKDDYVTFDRTCAYFPENWAVIQDLRERAANGEDVNDEVVVR